MDLVGWAAGSGEETVPCSGEETVFDTATQQGKIQSLGTLAKGGQGLPDQWEWAFMVGRRRHPGGLWGGTGCYVISTGGVPETSLDRGSSFGGLSVAKLRTVAKSGAWGDRGTVTHRFLSPVHIDQWDPIVNSSAVRHRQAVRKGLPGPLPRHPGPQCWLLAHGGSPQPVLFSRTQPGGAHSVTQGLAHSFQALAASCSTVGVEDSTTQPQRMAQQRNGSQPVERLTCNTGLRGASRANGATDVFPSTWALNPPQGTGPAVEGE